MTAVLIILIIAAVIVVWAYATAADIQPVDEGGAFGGDDE